ncbi:hypothetical protein [Pontibacter sp. Tf4]|uniref:immunoglobulin domain-containing protein n=1 Tax=Pontibacter sp. Tf4 TaxID=2761620 RepID=UPI001C894C0E
MKNIYTLYKHHTSLLWQTVLFVIIFFCWVPSAIAQFGSPGGAVYTISGPSSVCVGTTQTYTAYGERGCSTPTWNIEGGTYVQNGNQAIVTWTQAGNNSVMAFGGCPDGNGNMYLTSGSMNVNVVQAPATSVTASATTVCAGTAVTLTASGANTYSWSHSLGTGSSKTVTPTVTTTYTITGTNSGCSPKTVEITINVNPVPSVPTVTGGGTICYGQGTSLSASGSGASTFRWYDSSGTQLHEGSTYQIPNTLAGGSHNYTVSKCLWLPIWAEECFCVCQSTVFPAGSVSDCFNKYLRS